MNGPEQVIWGTQLRSNALSVTSDRAATSVRIALQDSAPLVFQDLYGNPEGLVGPGFHSVPRHALHIARTLREATVPIIEVANTLNPDHPKTLIDPVALDAAQTNFYDRGLDRKEDIARRRQAAHRIVRSHTGGWVQLALAYAVRSIADRHTDLTSQLIFASTGDYLIYGSVVSLAQGGRQHRRLQRTRPA